MLCADIITEMIEDDFLQEVEKGHYKLNVSFGFVWNKLISRSDISLFFMRFPAFFSFFLAIRGYIYVLCATKKTK